MLGWFKKKFKKQEGVPPPAEPAAVGLDAEESATPRGATTEAVAAEPAPVEVEPAPEAAAVVTETDKAKEQAGGQPPPPVKEQPRQPLPATTPLPAPAAEPGTDQPVAKTQAGSEVDQPLKVVKQAEVDKVPGRKKSFFSRLSERLGKTRESFTYQLDALFLGKKEIDGEMLDDLEEILITADLGVATTQELLESARRKVRRKELYDPRALKETLKADIRRLITDNDQDATLVMPDQGPFVIMVIGVNGVGKTTTIGKIARKFQQAGKSVLLVAADTFRAAAVAQLQIWGERSNIPVIAHKEGADPSSVVFDALGIAQAKNIEVVLVDTAGRMHTKDNLMEELKKIKRVMAKKLPGAPHEVMLVIDATTGQNGISQARLFDDAVGVTGITLTKLDGTSKGGIVANICKELKIPIRFIGIGEKTTDLRDFDASEFVEALFQSRADETGS